MRTRKTLFGVMVAAAMAAGGGGGAAAQDRSFAATGRALLIAQGCARRVAVEVDPALSTGIVATATADHPEEIDQIAAETEDGRARLGLRDGLRQCWTPRPGGDFTPTLVLRVRIPAGFPVSVQEAGFGDYAIDRTGPLALSLSGAVTLSAAEVSGDTQIASSGDSRVRIDRIDAPALSVRWSGSGSLQVGAGRIGTVSIQDSGDGRLRIAPTVDSASLSASGAGSIALGGVRGSLARSLSGDASVIVAGQALTGGTGEDR